jgi:zinc protease
MPGNQAGYRPFSQQFGRYNGDMGVATEQKTNGRAATRVLDNGLTIVVQEEHTAPLASVWCWYKVGSKDEVPGLTGVSHWVEHMNFKGTTNIPRDQVKGIIEQFGGSWNGYTWIDQTTYLETATRDALDRMLFIESERMANGLYDPEDVESERTVIISELQGGENDPDQLLDTEVTAAAFKAHPYGHPTIGWLSDLRRMTRDELYGYYRRYYVPNNATLVVVGDVEPDDVFRAADRQFGGIAPGVVPPRIYSSEPAQIGERRVTISREGTTAYLKIAYHAPAVGDPDFVAMLMIDAVLTGAKGVNLWSSFRTPPPQRSARLYRSLVDSRLASSVGGAVLPTQDPFLYSISITANDGVALGAVEQAAVEQLDGLAARGVTDQELAKARRQLTARLVFENDSVTNIAHQIGYFATVANVEVYRELASRIPSVSLEQVNAAAARYLRTTNRTIGWFQPLPPGSGAPVAGDEPPTSGPIAEAR